MLEGMLMLVTPIHPAKVESLIDVTPKGMMYAPVLWLGAVISSVLLLLKSDPPALE
jgi:hypothetical protein